MTFGLLQVPLVRIILEEGWSLICFDGSYKKRSKDTASVLTETGAKHLQAKGCQRHQPRRQAWDTFSLGRQREERPRHLNFGLVGSRAVRK